MAAPVEQPRPLRGRPAGAEPALLAARTDGYPFEDSFILTPGRGPASRTAPTRLSV